MDCLVVGIEYFTFVDKKTGEPTGAFNVHACESDERVHGFRPSKLTVFKGSSLFENLSSVYNSPQKYPCLADCSFNSRGQLVSFGIK